MDLKSKGYSFKRRHGKVNWEQVSSLDFKEATMTGDIEGVQPLLENLCYSMLDKEDLERIGDPRILKVFKLMQLGMEYLHYEQNSLHEQGSSYQSEYQSYYEKNQHLQTQIDKTASDIQKLKKEGRQKRKAVFTYEHLLRQPATSTILNKAMTRANSVKCEVCSKSFVSKDYLQKHIERRHSKPAQEPKESKEPKEPKESKKPKESREDTLQVLKELMSQQLQVINEAHTAEIQSLKSAFQEQLQGILTKTQELLESQKQEIHYVSPTQPQPQQLVSESVQQEKEVIKNSINEHTKKIEENDRTLRKIQESSFTLIKQKEEIEKKLEEVISKSSANSRMISPSKQKLEVSPYSSPNRLSPIESPELKNLEELKPSELEPSPRKPESNAGELEDDEKWEEDMQSISFEVPKKPQLEKQVSSEYFEEVEVPQKYKLETDRKENLTSNLNNLFYGPDYVVSPDKFGNSLKSYFLHDPSVYSCQKKVLVDYIESELNNFKMTGDIMIEEIKHFYNNYDSAKQNLTRTLDHLAQEVFEKGTWKPETYPFEEVVESGETPNPYLGGFSESKHSVVKQFS